MASKRNQRRRACQGKIRHTCEEHAKLALRGHHRKYGYDRGIRYYKCPACGGWHLGHASHQVQRAAGILPYR